MEPVTFPTEDPDVQWDDELVERFLSDVTETASGILDLSNQVKELKKMMDESVRKQTLELEEREKDSDLRQSLEAQLLILVLEMQTKEVVAQVKKQQREVHVRAEKLEEREKVLSSLVENVQERCNELEKREEQFQVKDKDAEVKRKELDLKEKKVEEMMSELDAREKERSFLDETIKEKFSELEKREELFKMTQDSEAKEIEAKMRSLELKEMELEDREKLLQQKEKELDEQSTKAANRKRSRNESESPLFAVNDGDDNPPLIHTGKRHKPDTDLDFGVYGRRTSTDLATASSSEANEIEVYEVECIDEDPEPYNCLDADFNNFNNTISSFSVGQVWALYDPSDHMPRFYALIRKVLELQLRVEVTWLEPTTQCHKHKPLPIACGEFKYGDKTTSSHLMFSHLMLDHIRTTGGKKKKSIITINPRKGETWALFRDWSRDKQQKRPYSYDFVQVLTEFDSVHGIGVAYLGRVEGFTSLYEYAEQNKVLQKMIPSDEMLRFSHRVPSFELDEEKDGVPAGSFELDPAAIPRDYLEGLKDVKEEEEEGTGRSLGLSLVQSLM